MMTKEVPKAGVANQFEDGLACVLAPNPSPMTHWGDVPFHVEIRASGAA
jgi:hypothetical protein